MQGFKRPPEPPDFKKNVEKERDNVRLFFSSRRKKKKEDDADTKPVFPPKWKDYKAMFAEAQHRKCGYCEMRVIGGQHGDVDHFRPKGEIWHLKPDPSKWGREKDCLSNVEGREREVICQQGYWWLAYDWSNYILSCMVCNEFWKLSYFHVKDTPRKVPPTKRSREQSLLLDPFDENEDPTKHLKFDLLGQIKPKNGSERGFETIRTCGLDRESLRAARMEKARNAYYFLARLLQINNQEEKHEIFCRIYSAGDITTDHSGMVRSIFEEYSGMSWEELEKIVKKHPCPEIPFSFVK